LIDDTVLQAVKNLRREGLRTFLTLIGVVIGIAAIVALVSIGLGFSVAVENQLQSLGSNVIFVIPQGYGASRVQLTNNDLSQIENLSGVEKAVPIYSTNATIVFNGEKVNVSISATNPKDASLFESTNYFNIDEGRQLQKNESTGVLIGSRVAKEYFSKEINLKKQLQINDETYKVVGILKAQSSTFGGGPDLSGSIFMTTGGLERISSARIPSIVFVETTGQDVTEDTSNEIKDYFDKKYGEDSVMSLSTKSLLEQVNSILSLITVFIGGIAGISLIVGGIGIMNAMFSSVLERTREIGLYKALGASNRLVLSLILIESGLIGLIGGVIGMVLGFGMAIVIGVVGQAAGFPLEAVINLEIIIFALGFAILAGMISGYYPAKRAANLDPVEALRYE